MARRRCDNCGNLVQFCICQDAGPDPELPVSEGNVIYLDRWLARRNRRMGHAHEANPS